MKQHSFTAGFLFCGLGAGARGFLEAQGRLAHDVGHFTSLGGIDNDALACADFETLTNSKATCADVATLTPAELKGAWGERRPDVVFTSPPCKGFSGLLSGAKAQSPEYQRLNQLVFQGLFLVLETWPEVPPLIVLENVPRIATRGAELLAKVRQLLGRYGYVFHEATHDCGEVGGLAQHRRRYLLVARHPRQVTAYVYKPPKRRVKACGEVLGGLPMPEDGDAGVLHRMPRISWLNWVRLALIPAGGDWRDLPRAMEPAPTNAAKHQSKYRVHDWAEATGTIIGADSLGSGALSVADPRLELPKPAHRGVMGVIGWEDAAGTVTGGTWPMNGRFSVADPRLTQAVALQGTAAGADAFKGRPGLFGVNDWDAPSPTVTGRASVSGGTTAASVADPRILELLPHVPLGFRPRGNSKGPYGVLSWEEAAATVTGAGQVDNGACSVADPREAPESAPVIVAADGTWHRPLTTLEFATLQGLPAMVKGQPLQLAGRRASGWRERIGNAVPVQAATAIAESLLMALVATAAGGWVLGGTGIWVRRRDGYAEEAAAA